ncbi:4Fe-4S ferredoxin [Azospirillum thiophilum]|uniref:D-lactate dehydrogenase (cytochrome) n=1 Tax=Azospirillum thiophilum TaxID=528244 RepID=A0AAC8W5E1_9PROT|nr:FAD-binding and (Fe-S)-binding domain-containing protein [Azospirillum thiophilum]ALG75408.1 4Fe-4S ferredoxin [Azospirillum thiophilum]KJR62380.1 4Fe-4S ferredoxin [Azospirillum thiophilum]
MPTAAPPQATLAAPYDRVLAELATVLPAARPGTRLITDPLRTLAYGTDASFYRLIPKIVALVETEEEVVRLLRITRSHAVPVTFRAAGTSLSGQAVSDSVLVVLGDGWRGCAIGPAATTVTLQPGVIGAEANRRLAPLGRKIGPDPASIATAKIGGIAANNASGMCCGTAQNSYRTLESMRLVLADGTVLDTADPASCQDFQRSHGALLDRLAGLGARTRGDEALAGRIRDKFRIKNTTGYSLNALVDYQDPVDILQHLMIGSEGTLGFISSITLRTVPEHPHKASALLFFPDIGEACHAVALLKAAPVDAAELMDRASLRSIQDKPGMPPQIRGFGPDAAAVLVETRAESAAALDANVMAIGAVLADCVTIGDSRFTTDAKACDGFWKIRKGLFPAVGAIRQTGTTVIIEDVAFPLPRLAEATRDLQDLFVRHGYHEAIIFGHALEGNLHFVFTQAFDTQAEIDRYRRFMDDVAVLVVERYDGSLKAEHGTGRNMAPFVAMEWGPQAYGLMQEIKDIFDPDGLLNPGVILNGDPEAHLKNLKPLPPADPLVDTCIECGFCEPTCPSHRLTLSPRQRIVGRREIARLEASGDDPGRLAAIGAAYEYQGIDTCAACGLCATACPVGIETGLLIKSMRGERRGALARKAGSLVADHMEGTLGLTRSGLRLADLARRTVGHGVVQAAARALTGGHLPALPHSLPTAASFALTSDPAAGDDRPTVVYAPSCVSRTMGPAASDPQKRPLPEAVESVMRKAGFRIVYPEAADGQCCGMPLESKGLIEAADAKADAMLAALAKASDGGRHPVVMDTSPCTLRLRKRAADSGLRILDVAEFLGEFALPRLEIAKTAGPVMLHLTCSTRRMGLDGALTAVARACAETVVVPPDVGCCGFAGDKGFTTPELNAHALRHLPASVPDGCASGYSTSRTCEIGLSDTAGVPYRSIVYLVDACATAKVEQKARVAEPAF